jgi:hypothetical protein
MLRSYYQPYGWRCAVYCTATPHQLVPRIKRSRIPGRRKAPQHIIYNNYAYYKLSDTIQTEEKSINQSINQSRLVCSDTASAEAPFQLALRSTPRDILAVACSSRRLEVGRSIRYRELLSRLTGDGESSSSIRISVCFAQHWTHDL